jgi:NAD(P)-dependent dehydrogenase (short-subunit alcohol dehydrogenase family)
MEPALSMYLTYLICIIIIYKILDHILRIPKIDKPTGKKKNILITGCDTGFGNVFAKRMTLKGFTVFAGCLTEDGKRELQSLNRDTLKPFILDVTNKKSIDQGYIYVQSQLVEGGVNEFDNQIIDIYIFFL